MPQGLKNIYHLLVAFFSVLFFRYPGKSLTVIGVTGTDGKTTTVHLVYEILKTAGKRVSLISSVGAKIGGLNYNLPFHVTTPSPWQLQRFLRLAVNRGEKLLVLEVTSHGLDQNRVWGIPFVMGVLTNVSHEHLDYHQTFENYLAAKAKLFAKVKLAILNREDSSYEYLKSKIKNQSASWRTKIVTYGLKKGEVTLAGFPFETSLPGDYNKLNCLAAIAAAKTLKISEEKIKPAVAKFTGVLGRFEFVATGKDFLVVIDFAHTPNAFESLLSTVKPQVSGRLIHVFGSAGERDRLKRPKMGEISARYADLIVLTEEDYRSEDVNKIIEEIAQRIPSGRQVFKILNRQQAINFAVKSAQKGDLLLLTGKGHEKSLCRGKKEYPWSEHAAIQKALKLS